MTAEEANKRQLEVMKAISEGRVVQLRRFCGTTQIQSQEHQIEVWSDWMDVDVTDHLFHFTDFYRTEYRVAPFRFNIHIIEDSGNVQGFEVVSFCSAHTLNYFPSELGGRKVIKSIKLQFENNVLTELK